MKVIYVWDLYCGWCYGFKSVLSPFMQAHPELEIEVISGGLFDDQILSSSKYPHIPNANERISATYGTKFGEEFSRKILGEGIHVNSCHTAAAFAILREYLPSTQHLALSSMMQDLYFQKALSLSTAEVYRPIIQHFALNVEQIEERLSKAFVKKDELHSDFDRARALGADVYPTLLLEHNGQIYDLKGEAMTLEALEENFKQITNK